MAVSMLQVRVFCVLRAFDGRARIDGAVVDRSFRGE